MIKVCFYTTFQFRNFMQIFVSLIEAYIVITLTC